MFPFVYPLLVFLAAQINSDCYCPTSVAVRRVLNSTDSVTYIYTVTNRSKQPIYGVVLGQSNDGFELSELPEGCQVQDAYCACALQSPKGWSGCVHLEEGSDDFAVDFRADAQKDQIGKGAAKEFSLTVPRADPRYECTGFRTFAGPGCSFQGVAGKTVSTRRW